MIRKIVTNPKSVYHRVFQVPTYILRAHTEKVEEHTGTAEEKS